MASASIVSANFAPSLAGQGTSGPNGDHTDYLYFGADVKGDGHSMLANNAVIGQAMNWGVPFTFQKFNPQIRTKFNLDDPNSFRITSVSEYNANAQLPQGTSVMLSCYDTALFNLQHSLNQQYAKDQKCKKVYIASPLWGTIGKMDFKKDGILLNICVLLEVDTSAGCTLPSNCHAKVYKDLTQETNAGSVREGSIVTFGPVKNIEQVSTALKDWATKNKQQVSHITRWFNHRQKVNFSLYNRSSLSLLMYADALC